MMVGTDTSTIGEVVTKHKRKSLGFTILFPVTEVSQLLLVLCSLLLQFVSYNAEEEEDDEDHSV